MKYLDSLLINKYIREFADIRKISEEEAEEIAEKELEKWEKDIIEYEFSDKQEINEEDVIEMFFRYKEESYLSFELREVDFYNQELHLDIITAWGGPTLWIPLIIDENGIYYDHEEGDRILLWYKGAYGEEKRLRDFCDYSDVVFYNEEEELLRIIAYDQFTKATDEIKEMFKY